MSHLNIYAKRTMIWITKHVKRKPKKYEMSINKSEGTQMNWENIMTSIMMRHQRKSKKDKQSFQEESNQDSLDLDLKRKDCVVKNDFFEWKMLRIKAKMTRWTTCFLPISEPPSHPKWSCVIYGWSPQLNILLEIYFESISWKPSMELFSEFPKMKTFRCMYQVSLTEWP